MNTKSKVMIGSGGGGVGFAAAIIIAWILSEIGVVMPVEVQTALGALLVWISERIGGYLHRERTNP